MASVRRTYSLQSLRFSGCLVAFAIASWAAADGVWRIERYADPMHKGGVIAAAEASAGLEDGASASVRCWSATGEIDVRFFLNDVSMLAGDEVHWRFDKGPVRTAHWRANPSGNALVVPEQLKRDIVRGMRAGREMSFSLSSSQRTYRVSLDGSAVPIGEVQTLCKR